MTLCLSLLLHPAQAQSVPESAPQEPPFVQEENEFENHNSDSAAEDDLFSIENEIQNANPEQKETVDLNEQLKNSSSEESLELAEPEEPPAPVPTAEPPVPQTAPRRESPRRGEVVRQSSKGGVEYIEHPQAAKGLMAITKDGSYIYRTKQAESSGQSGAFRVAMMDSPKIISADGSTNYETMYEGPQQPIFMFDYEWQPFSGAYGKLGVQAGLGVMYATGNGHFVTDDAAWNGKEAKEEYTFLAIPLSVGLIYRLEWMHRQWVAPYVAGGATYVPVAEIRDDGATPSMVGTPGVYGAGGMLFNISAIDRETGFTLNNEYGIRNLWVSVDYRYLKTFTEDLDFSSSIIGAGIVVDY